MEATIRVGGRERVEEEAVAAVALLEVKANQIIIATLTSKIVMEVTVG